MNFNTILFDLDDTLLDRNQSLRNFIVQFTAKYAGFLANEENLNFEDVFIDLDCSGYKPREEMFTQLVNATSWSIKPDIKEILNYWNIEFPQCAVPVPKLYEVLDYLQDKKIKMGVVTNSLTHFQYAKIDKLNLRRYMSTVIISEEVGMSKPDPAIFHLALSRADSRPETALFVGDYPSIDIKGAYDAHIASAWISYGKPWIIGEYKPDFIIDDLTCLMSLVDAGRI